MASLPGGGGGSGPEATRRLTTVEAERPDHVGPLDGVVAVEAAAPRRPPRFPAFDGLRAIDFLPADRRSAAARAWIAAWTAAAPRSRPAEALRIAEPLAHLAYAVRYQEFLDNIEPSEHVYHLGDPASSIRRALACVNDSCRLL